MPAPFKPVIRDELDVSNFAEEFTELDPTYSPAALPRSSDRLFQVRGRAGPGGAPEEARAGLESRVRSSPPNL